MKILLVLPATNAFLECRIGSDPGVIIAWSAMIVPTMNDPAWTLWISNVQQ